MMKKSIPTFILFIAVVFLISLLLKVNMNVNRLNVSNKKEEKVKVNSVDIPEIKLPKKIKTRESDVANSKRAVHKNVNVKLFVRLAGDEKLIHLLSKYGIQIVVYDMGFKNIVGYVNSAGNFIPVNLKHVTSFYRIWLPDKNAEKAIMKVVNSIYGKGNYILGLYIPDYIKRSISSQIKRILVKKYNVRFLRDIRAYVAFKRKGNRVILVIEKVTFPRGRFLILKEMVTLTN